MATIIEGMDLTHTQREDETMIIHTADGRIEHTADYHVCGGTILASAWPDPAIEPAEYRYCDRCGAFAAAGETMPDGVAPVANERAWDAGEARSPDAERAEMSR